MLLFAACSQSVQLPPPVPGPIPVEWTVTINNSPAECGEPAVYTIIDEYDFTLPDFADVNGYTLDCYRLGGTVLQPGDTITFSNTDIVLTAEWIRKFEMPAEPETPVSIADMVQDYDGDLLIELPAGAEYTETQAIAVKDNQKVVIRGTQGLSRAVGDKATINGSITVGNGSELVLENIAITAASGTKLIHGAGENDMADNVAISINNVSMSVPSGGSGIYIRMSFPESETNITAIDSDIVFEETASTVMGVAVLGVKNAYQSSVKINWTNSDIRNDFASASVYGLCFQDLKKSDVYISDSNIEIAKNYYSIYYNRVGSASAESKIDIKNSVLQGYSAVYLKESANVDVSINGGSCTSINANAQTSGNSCTMLYLEACNGCKIEAQNAAFTFGKYISNTDDETLFYIIANYSNHTNNSIVIDDCSITAKGYESPYGIGGFDSVGYYDKATVDNTASLTNIKFIDSEGDEYFSEQLEGNVGPASTEFYFSI